ncbi:putative cadherin [Fasciolopsis buskii]|uniref:Putative cadherin n=1 Tax=Fasciolopsis buskii TaxID=27845 RepID=A0A8E0RVE9_9TREM|nr:putative cadherin [Fasciolopsis buski]
MQKSRNLIILISPQPHLVIVLFLIILVKANLSGNVVRSQKSRSTKIHLEQFRVNFNLPDELPANHFIGNIPSQLPTFPFSLSSDLSVSTTLLDNINLASKLLRTSDSGDLYTLAAIDRDNREQICGPLNCCRLMVCNLTVEVLFVHPNLADVTVHVSLQLHDENDNFPHFAQPTYSLWIPEDNGLLTRDEQRLARSLYELPSGSDLDSDPNGIVQYRLTGNPNAVSTFRLYVNLTEGQLKLGLQKDITLDYETLKERIIKLTIQAIDGGQPTHTTEMLLVIHVTDLNDNRPAFAQSTETIQLAENHIPDGPIYVVHATDADTDDNALIRYSFGLGNPHVPSSVLDHFSFHPTTGKLNLRKPFDYENYSERQTELRFVAQDAGNPPLSSTMKLIIKVTDINDNPPQLVVQTNRTIVEHTAAGQLALRLMVRDLDAISQHTVRCEGEANQLVPLRMESSTDNTILNIITTASIDREQHSSLHYSVTCVDSAEPRQIVRFTLVVAVQDINDNAPIFRFPPNQLPRDQYNITVSEGEPVNKLILIVTADDADSEQFGKVVYNLFDVKTASDIWRSQNQLQSPPISYKTFFKIDPETGSIFLTKRLDYELTHKLLFGVMAKDSPLGPESMRKSATALITVNIQDINDNPPQLESPHRIDVVEHCPVGTNLGAIRFSDPDSGSAGKVTIRGLISDADVDTKSSMLNSDTLAYSVEKYFKLTEQFQLVTTGNIDREQTPRFFLRILAVDNGDHLQLATTATVTINVIDINDNSPIMNIPKPNSTVIHTPVKPDDDLSKMLLNKIDEDTNRLSKESTSVSKLLDLAQTDKKDWDRILHAHVSNQVLLKVQADDADVGENARISYLLEPYCNGSEYFHLDPTTGFIRNRLKRVRLTENQSMITKENIAWIPQVGRYLFCIRLTDHGEPPLGSSSIFWLNVTSAVSKATIKAMWPSDSAEYTNIRLVSAVRRVGDAVFAGSNQTLLGGSNQMENGSDISMSNIVILLMAAIFGLTLICALTASIMWAHSKHRWRRDRTSKATERKVQPRNCPNTNNDGEQERFVIPSRQTDGPGLEENHSKLITINYDHLSTHLVPKTTPKSPSLPSTEEIGQNKISEPHVSYSNSCACTTTALCELTPIRESQLRLQPCSFALTPDCLATSGSTLPNPTTRDICTVRFTPKNELVQTQQTDNLNKLNKRQIQQQQQQKQQQQKQKQKQHKEKPTTSTSSAITQDMMETSTTPLLDTSSGSYSPSTVSFVFA